MSPDSERLRVGLIGHGAVGGAVAARLEDGAVPGCSLSGVVDRGSSADDMEALILRSDVVVEAAGHAALTTHGPTVVGRGRDLLVVSVGALVDDRLLGILGQGGGRLLVSTGAIGGLDLLRAAALVGPLGAVSLESTKRPQLLVQPWMDTALVARLEQGRERVEAFSGSARHAAARFPASANVAATLGLATVGLDETRVSVVGDPAANRVRHVVRAEGAAGTYQIVIENEPSATNPRTSAITPYAVVRALTDLRAGTVIGV